MSHATRPLALKQFATIGTCRLKEIPGLPEVRITAIGTDQITGRFFYVVQGDGPCFGIWPDEVTEAAFFA